MRILAIAVLATLSTPTAAEFYVPASMGKSIMQLTEPSPNVAWTQQGWSHESWRESPAWTLGIGYQSSPYMRYELSYVDLGSIAIGSMWGPSDHEWVPDDDNCLYECPKTHYGSSYGRVKGVSLIAVPTYPVSKNLSIGLKAGAFYWHAKWTTLIADSNNDYARDFIRYSADRTTGISGVVGAFISYKQFDLSYMHYRFEPRDGSIDGAIAYTIGYRFDF